MKNGITQKGRAWEWKNSLWMFWTFIPFSFFNYISFYYIGYRVKQRKWTITGVVYSIPFILLIVGMETVPEDHWFSDMSFVIYFLAWIVSLIHVFRIRPEYLLRLEKLKDSGYEEKEMERLKQSINREYALSSAPVPPVQNVKPAQPKTETLHVLDVNLASEEEIGALPMIGAILAKKAALHKEQNGGFQNFEEFCQVLQLKPHVMERVKTHVAFSPVKKPAAAVKSGRIVDF
ncbi:ComEA family DNA-binding protein [Fictibacillus aquaticus]|uniref:Helix-hairpin-helix DNA-binding motif class 1 domain-containing protein n=1 Tax=Fictibacillus aquaticus TaxID=2021314 RepID=A0A235F9D0_9BACL|nr:helix-hairpin-helix domain-containing protein [Fictibacillus aquaticus]OYD57557.1 hypothetical protein CGZ90_12870 [Fictibacillus aquaticus]